uniref:Uncharacterized protein n=1 Tax=Rhizophora mucronata TaxID=61149 RepID=A0A2P2NA26_RHIMU
MLAFSAYVTCDTAVLCNYL